MTAAMKTQGGDCLPIGGLSHVRGPTDQPLWHKTIPALFSETVARFGQRDAAVFCEFGTRYSYDEFSRAVDRLAAGLLKLGLKKGDRIGIWSPNRPEWVLTQFATARVGLIMVNINPAYRVSELEYVLNKVGCKALVTASEFKSLRLSRHARPAGAGAGATRTGGAERRQACRT